MRRKTHEMKPLPPIEYLKICLIYRNGMVFWKSRPLMHFVDLRSWATWNANYAGKRAGSPINSGRRLICLDNEKYLEHRIIFHIEKGPLLETDYVDHRNHDHTDNTINNLRKCNHPQNLMNQPARRRKSGICLPKHVYWSKREKKYKVAMRAQRKIYWIGTFLTLESAEIAATNAAKRLHRSFRFGADR